MSPSMASTRLPLMARLTARLDDTKDLPEPGLNEVTATTLLPDSRIMNSRLVRSTLKASLATSRQPWRTTTASAPPRAFRLPNALEPAPAESGISPAKGTETPLRSRRERTLVSVAISR